MKKKQRVGIVGGGLLGMRLSEKLAAAGDEVALFEAASSLGGLASAWQLGDYVWDRHYHVTLMSDSETRALHRALDLDDEMAWVETRTGFYCDDRLYSMSNSFEFLRFPPLGLIDKFRLGVTILYASRIRQWQRLEKISAVDWLRKWSGKRTVEKMWLPLLRSKLGDNAEKASAAFIWAIIARMYKARQSGLKKEMFGYLPGGYARMLAAYETRLRSMGVSLRLAEPVSSVTRGDSGLVVATATGSATFDKVVVTQAPPIARRLCPELDDAEKSRLDTLEYQGVLCASVLLKKPLGGFYVTNITDDWVPFTGVIEMTALVDPETFGGNSLVYLPKYVTQGHEMAEWDDRRIQEVFCAALLRMYPHLTKEDIITFQLSRVKYCVAVTTLDYSANLPPFDTSVPGLFLVNSSQIVNGTLNVNETLQLADKALTVVQGEGGAQRGQVAA